MTNDQRKQYEEAAKEYANKFADTESEPVSHGIFKKHYLAGCSHAHSKIEEAEREAWNRALEAIALWTTSHDGPGRLGRDQEKRLIEELKKLRK